jgi:hypothetical protein
MIGVWYCTVVSLSKADFDMSQGAEPYRDWGGSDFAKCADFEGLTMISAMIHHQGVHQSLGEPG